MLFFLLVVVFIGFIYTVTLLVLHCILIITPTSMHMEPNAVYDLSILAQYNRLQTSDTFGSGSKLANYVTNVYTKL